KPEDADFRKERGKLYRAKGERDRASADFTKAIEIYSSVIASSPSDFAAYWQRADVHALSGDEVAMIADYDKIVVLLSDPKTAVDFNRRAWAHFKANRAEKGLPDAVRSLEIAPDNADALDTRGHILEALGRREEANRRLPPSVINRSQPANVQRRVEASRRSMSPWLLRPRPARRLRSQVRILSGGSDHSLRSCGQITLCVLVHFSRPAFPSASADFGHTKGTDTGRAKRSAPPMSPPLSGSLPLLSPPQDVFQRPRNLRLGHPSPVREEFLRDCVESRRRKRLPSVQLQSPVLGLRVR